MKLVITEKPSVAQSIAKVLGVSTRCNGYLEGNGYIVSWCVGHLIELCQPEQYDQKYKIWEYKDLPIFPEIWKYSVSESTKHQYEILNRLMHRNDVLSIVCATDAGREGELIFRLVYNQCQCHKPFERLWISSMEDSAITAGFANLYPSTQYDSLYDSALCRERADWIVGINATRLFSTLYDQTLNIGRVMTPTLSMVVSREAEISAFTSEKFYTVKIGFDNFTAVSEHIKTKAEADTIMSACCKQRAVVVKSEKKAKSINAPALYDLTSLQRDANRILGFTAAQTLNYAQSLYEKKLISYPRTDCRYLTAEMEERLPNLVKTICAAFYADYIQGLNILVKQTINPKKITDHHAIIPTIEVSNTNMAELQKGEFYILKMIATRLIAAVEHPNKLFETVIELDCAGTRFKAKGTVVESPGWKKFDNNQDKKENNIELPNVAQGDSLQILKADVLEGATTPPKHFTEDTLLQSMETAGDGISSDEIERKGLGTPATRAGIIEKLVQKGYLDRVGDKKTKHLLPTRKGTALITVIPEQIQSPTMTADWEAKLLLIEKGEYESERFMDEIQSVISNLIETYKVESEDKTIMSKEATSVGVCPICGKPVISNTKGFFCSNKQCNFALWRNNRYFESIGKPLDTKTVEKLLSSGEVYLKKCKSKRTGNNFDATLIMSVNNDGKPQFQMQFNKGGN